MSVSSHYRRIVHVTNTFDDDGCGITNMLIDLVDAQLSSGCHVEVLAWTEQSDAIERLVSAGGSYRKIPQIGSGMSLLRASRIVRRQSAGAVLHAHTVKALAAVCLAAPTRWRKVTVATLHNEFQRSAFLMALAGRLVCVSEENYRSVSARVGIQGRRVRLVKNGVVGGPRMGVSESNGAVPSLADAPTILYVGGMEPRKGVDLLVRRFSLIRDSMPEVRLALVGNEKSEIRQLINELGLRDYVQFLGFHPRPALLMKQATVVAVPSRREPFGLVALEARSVGAPVVASDIDGLRDALSHGQGGILVGVDDEEGWISSLISLLGDPRERSRVQARARIGLDEFSTSRMAQGYFDVYAELDFRRVSKG